MLITSSAESKFKEKKSLVLDTYARNHVGLYRRGSWRVVRVVCKLAYSTEGMRKTFCQPAVAILCEYACVEFSITNFFLQVSYASIRVFAYLYELFGLVCLVSDNHAA